MPAPSKRRGGSRNGEKLSSNLNKKIATNFSSYSSFSMFPSTNFHQNYPQRIYAGRFPFGSSSTTPSPPLNLPIMPTQQIGGVKSGAGTLIWLTPQTGLLSFTSPNEENNQKSAESGLVSFEIKDFGDQAVSDLTQVLRIGFVLKFQAILPLVNNNADLTNKPRYVATFVAPASTDDLKAALLCYTTLAADLQRLAFDLDTHQIEPLPCPDQSRRQNPYDVERETKSVQFVLNIFRDGQTPHCPLHTIHCIVSNCGDEQLYNYIGTSSMKRRQFVERRGHLFSITAEDLVCLVPGALNVAVTTLVAEMLKRGGAMLLQELFDLYSTWAHMPLESRDLVGETKQQFLKFLETYPWIYAVFPSRVFVAVRRRLPDFNYSAFLVDCFGDQEGSPLWNYRRSSPPTPKFNCPPTPFSAASNYSEDNATSTKFPFVHNDPNLNFPPIWSNEIPPTPTAQFLPCNSSAVGAASTTNSSSVGSSSLSLASLISESAVPPTPPGGGFQTLHIFGASSATSASVEPTTPGFWKSYDLGTEEFVKNLTNFAPPTVVSPRPSTTKNLASSSANSANSASTQTNQFSCRCPKCDAEWIFKAENVKKSAETREISCQTTTDEENSSISDEILLDSVAKMALDD